MKPRIAIIAGYNSGWITKNELASFDVKIGVDRGAYILASQDIPFDVAIGDFDSITRAELKTLRQTIPDIRIYPKEKDQTDLELGIQCAFEYDPREIVMYGVFGGRVDHGLVGMHLLEGVYAKGIDAHAKDNANHITLVHGTKQLRKSNQYPYLSIIPSTPECIVSVFGCKYPLNKHRLKRGETLGVSNVILADAAEITVHEGVVWCIYSADTYR